MKFTLYTADCTGNEKNTIYPREIRITSEETMKNAAAYDHVCASYQRSHRSNEDFIKSDVISMDCDNDHSEIPDEWITPEMLTEALSDVEMVFVFSRNHNKVKKNKAARPKFHVFFPVKEISSAAEYTNIKKQIHEIFPFFDSKALDAAHFYFGSDGDILWQEGSMSITDYLALMKSSKSIPQGSRNATMSQYAGRILKRLGNTEEAKRLFLEQADLCEPPLDKIELRTIWQSAVKFYKKVSSSPDYVAPDKYNTEAAEWVEPIPFSKHSIEKFPVSALPKEIADYVVAVAESTQTPVDMAGTLSLSIMAMCIQTKYRIQGKADWIEPLNLYSLIIAPPSERKSAVSHMMLKPVNNYEVLYNTRNASKVESNRSQRRVLEKRQRAVEEQFVKGKATREDLDDIAEQLANFKDIKSLQLYVDDITPEKLVSVLAENRGKAAMISSEGGIFDTLAGSYSKNVNIDVMLKAYSGDTIRVDRIGRDSENVMNPTLTVLLMAQPNVISTVLSNSTFRGRGLTARFLYCMPSSSVGTRKFHSKTVPDSVYSAYEHTILDYLCDENHDKVIKLSHEAECLIAAFAEELEPKLIAEYAEMSDWVGKLVGNTLRIAGLLCRAQVYRADDFLVDYDPLVVDGETMKKAIKLSRYFLNHAQAAYDVLPENDICSNTGIILKMIKERQLAEFDRREAMRYCRHFKTVAEIQPVLDALEDYGYIARKPEKILVATGRPPLPKYAVNPLI
jgi:hypothetical protein